MTQDNTNKMSSQDAQGRWYELLSPSQVLTGENEKQLSNEDMNDTASQGSMGNEEEEVEQSMQVSCKCLNI